jgi:hypothetical protein
VALSSIFHPKLLHPNPMTETSSVPIRRVSTVHALQLSVDFVPVRSSHP